MEQEFEFKKKKLIELLQDLQSTKKSITETSDLFIEMTQQNFHKEVVNEWKRIGKDFLNIGEESKLINFMFLCNDVNSKYQNEQLQEQFMLAIDYIVVALVDTPLNKVKNQCLKIFKIQKDRKLFPIEFLDKQIARLNQDKTDDDDKLPENLPYPPGEYIQLINNENQYNQYIEKLKNQEGKTEGEIKKLQELKIKYGHLTLKNYKDTIQNIDKQHMKSLVDYKLLISKIDRIEQILQARKENPKLLQKLPQTVSHDQVKIQHEQQQPKTPSTVEHNEGWGDQQ